MSGFLSITTLATSKFLYYFTHDVYLYVFSYSLLSAYDMGAPAKVLQAIYDSAAAPLNPIGYGLSKNEVVQIDENNWFNYLGDEKCAPIDWFPGIDTYLHLATIYYSPFVPFFTAEVAAHGGAKTLEKYIFSDYGNKDGRAMLRRMMGGSYVYFQIHFALIIDGLFYTF
jgi:Questin oxidase-like